jgi:hypothetical protein
MTREEFREQCERQRRELIASLAKSPAHVELALKEYEAREGLNLAALPANRPWYYPLSRWQYLKIWFKAWLRKKLWLRRRLCENS